MGVVVDAVSDVLGLMPAQSRPTPALGVELVTRLIRGLVPLDGRMLIVMEIGRLMTAEEQREVQAA